MDPKGGRNLKKKLLRKGTQKRKWKGRNLETGERFWKRRVQNRRKGLEGRKEERKSGKEET